VKSEKLPTTLQEAIDALDKLLPLEDRQYIEEDLENDPDVVVIALHHSLGRYIRNKWGLWEGGPLAQHMREVEGIIHPDDMSGHIIRQYVRSKYPNQWEHLLRNPS
jgi:hypothetical protein